MSAIYILLGISITVAIVFFIVFILSVKNGQYDDVYTPSVRILFDDELVEESPKEKSKSRVLTKQKQS